jgi:hypothetical protein
VLFRGSSLCFFPCCDFKLNHYYFWRSCIKIAAPKISTISEALDNSNNSMKEIATPEPVPSDIALDTSGFFGHPKGLTTLFFTELWERFSYYGMRAILVLYMVAPPDKGGLGFGIPEATPLYGTYTMFVYLTNLPGGLIADRVLGARVAVLLGGIIIACGHFLPPDSFLHYNVWLSQSRPCLCNEASFAYGSRRIRGRGDSFDSGVRQ